jgi:glyoxylase-like metal-dependent hydrolase (beta-lactamase superfamily II)
MGTKVIGKYVCFYVEADGKKIMVDTGPASPEHMIKWHKEMGPQIAPDQQSMIQLQKQAHVKPEEIDMILLTHLHYDHAYHLEKFPNAKIYISKAELSFALNPLPPYFPTYENWQIGMTPFFIPSIPRMVQIDMVETKITEHVSMIPTSGHCPGHMSVVVETSKGPYVLAGDAVCTRENLTPLPERHLPFRMIGLFMDFQAAWKSIETIIKIVDGDATRVLCCHDPAALTKKVYPQ